MCRKYDYPRRFDCPDFTVSGAGKRRAYKNVKMEPLLVAAHELKDAIENVAFWKKALAKYIKEEREYVKDKNGLLTLLAYIESDSPKGYKSIEEAHNYLNDVVDEVISFAKGEGYK